MQSKIPRIFARAIAMVCREVVGLDATAAMVVEAEAHPAHQQNTECVPPRALFPIPPDPSIYFNL